MDELRNQRIAGVILAGGNSRRLSGIAKGAIELDSGSCIIERLIKELAAADVTDIVIVANDSKPYQKFGVKIISDIRVGLGPIGGIETGLDFFSGRCDAVMFVPCDMPNITAKELSELKSAFVKSDAGVVFAETSGFFYHPLCTVVHNDLADVISTAIDSGLRKIRDIWQSLGATTVRFDNENAFFNINSHTDIEHWYDNCGVAI